VWHLDAGVNCACDGRHRFEEALEPAALDEGAHRGNDRRKHLRGRGERWESRGHFSGSHGQRLAGVSLFEKVGLTTGGGR
jgi:hypothetical protein